jgi:hypothetical protein
MLIERDLVDLMEDPYFARWVLQKQDDTRKGLVRSLIEKKFGIIPSWVDERLAACSAAQVDGLALKILDCATLDDLFR